MKDFFRFLFWFWIYMWNYSLFHLSFFTSVQQFLSQIELWQNLQLNKLFDQLTDFFWAADETSNVHLICVQICYLMSYFSKMRAVFYYMHCSLFCSAALTDRKFYFRHLYFVQECYEINSVYFYLNNHCIFYLVKNCMLLDHSMFWFSDF